MMSVQLYNISYHFVQLLGVYQSYTIEFDAKHGVFCVLRLRAMLKEGREQKKCSRAKTMKIELSRHQLQKNRLDILTYGYLKAVGFSREPCGHVIPTKRSIKTNQRILQERLMLVSQIVKAIQRSLRSNNYGCNLNHNTRQKTLRM